MTDIKPPCDRRFIDIEDDIKISERRLRDCAVQMATLTAQISDQSKHMDKTIRKVDDLMETLNALNRHLSVNAERFVVLGRIGKYTAIFFVSLITALLTAWINRG